LHQAELAHAIEQQVFQRRISAVQASRAYDGFEEDRKFGRWLESAMPEAAFDMVIKLARRHVARLGCRTLDTLHIACALELGATKFLTFDHRQEELAKAVGLALA
jgi:predicted nucleic acid-binding protein